MKRRCIYCGKLFESEDTVCLHCHKDNDEAKMDKDQIHELHRNCHREINKYNDVKNSGLTFLVTGAILLVIGLIFLVLSFRYNVIKVRVFTPGSVEFVVCVVTLCIGVAFLSIGIEKLVVALQRLKFFQKTILESEQLEKNK